MMLNNEFNHGDHQLSRIPDHLKCGEVYTWQCADELYAVECNLCEDHPLCPLSEFPQHMEIWHTEWEVLTPTDCRDSEELQSTEDETENQSDLDNYNNDLASLGHTEDSSLHIFESDDQLQNERAITRHKQYEEILEPFEQVLIEQEIVMQGVNEEDFLEDESIQTAEADQSQIETKQKQSINTNQTLKHILNEVVASANEITECGRELQYSTDLKESEGDLNVNKTKDLRSKQKRLQCKINQKNIRKHLEKCRNHRRNLNNINKSDAEDSESREYTNCCNVTKRLKQNLSKIKKNKVSLSEIVRDISALSEIDVTESQFSENATSENENKTECQNISQQTYRNRKFRNNWNHLINLGKRFKIKKEESKNNTDLSKRKWRRSFSNLRNIQKTFKTEKEIFETETEEETNETEKRTSEIGKEIRVGEREASEMHEAISGTGQSKETEVENKNCEKFVKQVEYPFKIKDNGLTENRICEIKSNKIETTSVDFKVKETNDNEDESDTQVNEVKLNNGSEIKENVKSTIKSTKTRTIKNEVSPIRNKTEFFNCGITANESETYNTKYNEFLRKSTEMRAKAHNYSDSKRKPRKKLKKNKSEMKKTLANETNTMPRENYKETSENETNSENFCDCLQKSIEIRKKAENLLSEIDTKGITEKETITDKCVKITATEANERNNAPCNECLQPEEIREYSEVENLYEKRSIVSKKQCQNKIKAIENNFRRKSRKDLNKNKKRTNASETLPKEKATTLNVNFEVTNENQENNENFYGCLQKSVEISTKAQKFLNKIDGKDRTERETVTAESAKIPATNANEANNATCIECLQTDNIIEDPEKYLKQIDRQDIKESETETIESVKTPVENLLKNHETLKGNSNEKHSKVPKKRCQNKTMENNRRNFKENNKGTSANETLLHKGKRTLSVNSEETNENENNSKNLCDYLQTSIEIRKNSKIDRRDLKERERVTNGSVKMPIANANDTNNAKFLKCLQKEEIENLLKGQRPFKRNSNENQNYSKVAIKKLRNKTEVKENKMKEIRNLISKNFLCYDTKNLRRTKTQNNNKVNESEIQQRGTNEKEQHDFERKEKSEYSQTSQINIKKNMQNAADENKVEKQEYNESETDDLKKQKKYQKLVLKYKIRKSKAINKRYLQTLSKRNNLKRQLLSHESGRKNSTPIRSQPLKPCSFRSYKSIKTYCEKKSNILRKKNYLLRNHFNTAKSAGGKTDFKITKEETIIGNFPSNASREFPENSDFQESSDFALEVAEGIRSEISCADENMGESLLDSVQAKDEAKKGVIQKEKNISLPQKENIVTNTKQTLVTQYFTKKYDSKQKTLRSSDNSENLEEILISKQPYFQQFSSNEDSSVVPTKEPVSPLSPKTEEEHFEFYEPKEKLNKQHITHLIKLYQEHPRLWDQSHQEFCEPQVCRKSWERITEQWNEFCKRKFTIAEVRIRISTLCQRFIQEKHRLVLEGEVDECAKFPYYKQMQFLEKQKSLQKRRELYEQQNEKILEIYQHFPVLWHVRYYKLRKAKERSHAIESISKTLKLFGLHLSSMAVEKRLRSLRKWYRLEKIRHLHAQVEQTSFESTFRHYERMHFLNKHIDPFVCHICGKIFEHLPGFRQHLEAEDHGSVLAEENEVENESHEETADKTFSKIPLENNVSTASPESHINEETCVESEQESILIELENISFSPITNHMECFSASENSRDILQRFTPLSSTQIKISDAIKNSPLHSSENMHSNNIQEALSSPINTTNESTLDFFNLEDQLIEEIIEDVAKNDSLGQHGLDQFINNITSCEIDGAFELTTDNCATGEALSPKLFPAENSCATEHSDILADQTSCVLALSRPIEGFDPVHLYTGNPFIIEHPDIVTDQNVQNTGTNKENIVPEILHNEDSAIMAHPDIETDAFLEKDIENTAKVLSPYKSEPSPSKKLKHQMKERGEAENLSSPSPLVVKVQCADFSLDLKLNPTSMETLTAKLNDSDTELFPSADISTVPLPEHIIRKMIETYRKFPQLWNPNHLDFNSRILRRQAWCSLTTELNSAVETQISWRTLHRKLTDYVKYYKKLVMEQENYEQLKHKWAFYDDFKFMNDVIAVNNELQRSVHHRDNNFKIIATYKTLPQLWNIKHHDYNKRGTKQRNIEIMCNKLQEEYNLQLTTERLKNRLIELRAQYRNAKRQRLKCLKNNQKFSSTDFEYYEALNFLDEHIDPFVCDKCEMDFKKRTDYKQHLKKDHSRSSTYPPHEPGMENICHICGIKFTTRSNLVHHIKRHEGIRNYACNMCPKKFYASYSLKVHIRSHTKECPYTCEKCGMSFVSASKLNQHMKRHLNRKDFQCDFCNKEFFTAFEKDRHERRHLNIRDKVCPICGKTFVAGSSYYAHLMLHDNTKRFECDKCDMKFAQYAGLYKHKKRHHN